MKLNELLIEGRAPFKKGDHVVSKDGKHSGVVSKVDKAFELVTVKTHDGLHQFTTDFRNVKLDDSSKKPAKKLSPRDAEIKELIANGSSPEEVAKIMGIPVNKVLDISEGRMVKDPKSSDPYLRAGCPDGRDQYLKKLADDYDVPLKKVKQLADMLGPEEDFDALVVKVNDLSDPGK